MVGEQQKLEDSTMAFKRLLQWNIDPRRDTGYGMQGYFRTIKISTRTVSTRLDSTLTDLDPPI